MTYAVGSLVRARGREWMVLPGSDDGLVMLRPVGGTDIETTGILTDLETVEPATFPPPDPDDIGDEHSGRLLRDALRLGFRSSGGPFRSAGALAFDPRPYQLVPLLMALRMETVRLLIADDVGIGKTIEAGLIARELLEQGDIERTAILCAPHLADQWRSELSTKFHIDAEVVLPSTAARLERVTRMGQSLFDVHPHVVVSTDFIKSDRRRHEFLVACPEFVIVDEAHTCADPGVGGNSGRHQRHELLRRLAERPDRHLVLVTATPHSGKEGAFRSLLGLLDPAFADLPEDLSGAAQATTRRRLARHLVQRRRADIRAYLKADTPFPRRLEAEETYKLTPEYHRLFEDVLDYARQTVTDPAEGTTRRRVQWWSALALLRSIASSPAAAAETLRNRAANLEATTAAEADDIGRRTVLDQGEDEAAEAMDVTPGADWTDGDEAEPSSVSRSAKRRLADLARRADELRGPAADAKLAKATDLVLKLVKDGSNPIVFCRFIPTAEYVANYLAERLGSGIAVAAVTGTLPPAEREARIAELAAAGDRRVLVATDCLSEGINLQEAFDAVLHYDLSWNPTRHEQREGRVDRYGQPSPEIRTVTYYGVDNRIDGIVLEVLLRKHAAIRDALGVSVPVPVDAGAVQEAIAEGLLLRGADAQQLTLALEPQREELFAEWDDAAEREKRSRTVFSQEGINVEEVARELDTTRLAIGDAADVESFVLDALRAAGGNTSGGPPVWTLDPSETDPALRDAIGRDIPLDARFDGTLTDDEALLVRTHPVVAGLAGYVLDTALDPLLPGVAKRAGAVRSRAVGTRTTLLLCRFRFHVVTARGGVERPVLAEEARVLGYTGAPEEAVWLNDAGAEAVLGARADANISPEQARTFVRRAVEGLAECRPRLEQEANRLADELLAAHRRVREASGARSGVRYRVEAQLPVDVLGVYVYLPAGA